MDSSLPWLSDDSSSDDLSDPLDVSGYGDSTPEDDYYSDPTSGSSYSENLGSSLGNALSSLFGGGSSSTGSTLQNLGLTDASGSITTTGMLVIGAIVLMVVL